MRRIYWLWCLIIYLTACGGFGDDAGATQNEEGGVTGSVSEAEFHVFQRLEGTIGAYPIHMNLLRSTEPGNPEPLRLSGSYYYDRIGRPIQISGFLQQDTLIISEPGRIEGEPHQFSLVLKEGGGYTGVWVNGNTGRSLRVDLRLPDQVDLRFLVREVIDSIRLQPQATESPQAQYSLVWLEVQSGGQPGTASLVNQIIHEDILELDPTVTTFEGVLALRDTFFYYYREDAAAIGPIDPDDGYSAMLNYDHSAQMELLYVSDSLVSLSLTEYDYSGGAHGNYGTRLFTIDLERGKLLTLGDVLQGNYESRLTNALGTAAREYFELGRDDALSIVLFEDAVHPTENFALTSSGILFDYPPYDIAAYAVGEIQLFVPFERLRNNLHPAYRSW